MFAVMALAVLMVQLAAGVAHCVPLAASRSPAAPPPSSDAVSATLYYHSTVDSVLLRMVVVYPEGAENLPILTVMHTYSLGGDQVYETQLLLAERGLFTVAPSMRGRDGCGGEPDDSAREISDIIDAVNETRRLYAAETDGENLSIIGFSGGGGNVFGCLSKFPDFFRFGAAYFGMSDYGYDPVYGWYHYGGTSYQAMLRQRIGGSPAEVPDAYMARSSLLAVQNNRYTRLELYVDSQETICPVYNDSTYLRIALDLGHTNVSLNMSTPDSLYRWYHSLPHLQPDLIRTFDYYVPGILGGAYAQPVLDRQGEQTILGAIRTEPYGFVLGDGLSEVADLAYDVSGTAGSPDEAWSFALASRTGPIDPAALVVRGLLPDAPHVVEEEDVTHATIRTHRVWSDGEGTLHFSAVVDTVSVFRVYEQSSAGAREPATSRGRPPAWLAFPNPFRHTLVIRGPAWTAGPARLYDVAGRLIARLPASPSCTGCPSGVREWRWTGGVSPGSSELPPGVYFVAIENREGAMIRQKVVRVE